MSKLLKICDGNEAAAYVAYAFSEVAGIYPCLLYTSPSPRDCS